MAGSTNIRVHEVAFCAEVKSWADALFGRHADWPFARATIEEYGVGNYKRQDVRIYRKDSATPVLTGEVKMPGTPEGRTPYDSALMQDAFNKADNVQAPYFFTWNVNTLVLFDRSRHHLPMIERRVRDWDLGLGLTSAEACRRADVEGHIRDRFLPDFFTEFAEIVLGRAGEWGKPPDELFIRSLESHLDWPVIGTRDHLAAACQGDSAFAQKLQMWMSEEMNWTFDPDNPDHWRRRLCPRPCLRFGKLSGPGLPPQGLAFRAAHRRPEESRRPETAPGTAPGNLWLRHCRLRRPSGHVESGRPAHRGRGELSVHRPEQFLRDTRTAR